MCRSAYKNLRGLGFRNRSLCKATFYYLRFGRPNDCGFTSSKRHRRSFRKLCKHYIYIYCQEKYTKTPKKLSGENNLSMNSTPDNLTENDDLYIIKEVKFFVIALKYFFNTLPTLCKMCYTKLKYSNRSTAPEKVYRRWFEITRKDTGRKEKSNHHHR